MEKPQLRDAFGDDPTEPVAVKVEKRSIAQQTELRREVAGNVSVVEINASNDTQGRIVWRHGAENAIVVAYSWPDPVPSGVVRIGVDGPLPGPEGNVGPFEPAVGERLLDVELVHELRGPLLVLPEVPELSAGDHPRLGIGESLGDG